MNLFLLILLVFFSSNPSISRVKDGDTITYDGIVGRLAFVDCPEKDQPFGKEATCFLQESLSAKTKVIELGKGRYGRTLVILFADGKCINYCLVKVGLAEVMQNYPAEFWTESLLRIEKVAREKGRGMWSLGENYISPRIWRRMSREEKLRYWKALGI